ncbi:MAG: bifunctional demethylmenaquinone methyltransferase/2-methoxy-6-polyprenyl-1,4-benzoquinol methylase UbiE [Planctomycetes bacterium]|nr:bifunctional demethylmenaquinone methyltransferase/2-methoxy-6-polyprenyl-1,4-benzoquinol methylase UbiE [Planctomycetota bacterium]
MNQKNKHQWRRDNLKNPHQLNDKRQRVRQMFSDIAGSYDLLNHLLSLNLDILWRRRAVKLAHVGPGQAVLDLCCGTGDLAFAFAQAHPDLSEILGVDFAEPMLQRARQKTKNFSQRQSHDLHNFVIPKWLCQDAEHLKLDPNRFDCVSCAFGVRNLQNLSKGLQNIFHVLKPKGCLIILEFAIPKNPILAWSYAFYFRLVLPVIGSIIAHNSKGAYHYLPASVATFDTADQIVKSLENTGFTSVRVEKFTGGAVLAFIGHKP